MTDLVIGVLSLQGDFQSHLKILKKLNIKCRKVLLPKDFEDIDGLIIPGGESTVMTKLVKRNGLNAALEEWFKEEKPTFVSFI